MKFHASYNRHDSGESLGDPRLIPQEFIVHVPRLTKRERFLSVSWATPAPHMNILRVRRGVAQSLSRIGGTLLILSVLFFGISGTGGTVSYYADTEISEGNLMIADPLGFTLSLIGPSQVDMSEGRAYVIPVLTPNEDSEPIQFSVMGRMTSGDSTLCSNLHILATSSVVYDGPLGTFVTGMSTSTGEVPFYFSFEEGFDIPENTSCFVEFAFKGRNADAPQGTGYSDEKLISVQFYVPASLQAPTSLRQMSSPDSLLEEPPVLETDTASSTEETASSTPSSLDEGTTTELIVEEREEPSGQGSVTPPEETPTPPPAPEVIPPSESVADVGPTPEVIPSPDLVAETPVTPPATEPTLEISQEQIDQPIASE